jgi:large subunit ribosomal protein L30
MSTLKITQIKSAIDRIENQKRTMEALGLGKINRSVIKNDTPQIRGMLTKVNHLVKVEEVK